MKIPFLGFLAGPALSWIFGLTLNKACIASNGGLMPVLEASCRWAPTEQHTCMTPLSHLKWLGDWIYFANLRLHMSPGDVLMQLGESTIWFGLAIWAVLMIKDYNDREWIIRRLTGR
jgi:hypothetical protein